MSATGTPDRTADDGRRPEPILVAWRGGQWSAQLGPTKNRRWGGLLRAHLTGELDDLSVVDESWRGYEQVNVQAGLDAWLAEPGRGHELVGVIGFQHREFGLAELLGDAGRGPMDLRLGNVARVNLPCGPDGADYLGELAEMPRRVLRRMSSAVGVTTIDDQHKAVPDRGPMAAERGHP